MRELRWGLIPSWAKDPAIGSKLIDARVETLASTPSWRRAYRSRRAIVPAVGYYEWQPVEEHGRVRKQPYYMHPAGGGTLSFAALYGLWTRPAQNRR